MSWSNTLIDFAIVIVALIFVAQYTFRTRWWKNAAGIAVVFLASSIALIPLPKVLWTVFSFDVHDTTYIWTELICKVPVIFALVWLVITFEHVRQRGLRAKRMKEMEDAISSGRVRRRDVLTAAPRDSCSHQGTAEAAVPVS